MTSRHSSDEEDEVSNKKNSYDNDAHGEID